MIGAPTSIYLRVGPGFFLIIDPQNLLVHTELTTFEGVRIGGRPGKLP